MLSLSSTDRRYLQAFLSFFLVHSLSLSAKCPNSTVSDVNARDAMMGKPGAAGASVVAGGLTLEHMVSDHISNNMTLVERYLVPKLNRNIATKLEIRWGAHCQLESKPRQVMAALSQGDEAPCAMHDVHRNMWNCETAPSSVLCS